GDVLASTSPDGTTRLWDPTSGRSLVSAPGFLSGSSRDGRRLAFHRGYSAVGVWEVAAGQECRQLHYGRVGNRMSSVRSGAGDLDYGCAARLLMACGNDGVRFWDVESGADIGPLPIGRHESAFFDAAGGRLFTYGRMELRCWPVAFASDRTTLRIGPPEKLGVPGNERWARIARDRTGGRLAVNDVDRQPVILLGPTGKRTVAVGATVSGLDLSPDGRWLALEHGDDGVRIWDVPSLRPLEPQPARAADHGPALGRFSP